VSEGKQDDKRLFYWFHKSMT